MSKGGMEGRKKERKRWRGDDVTRTERKEEEEEEEAEEMLRWDPKSNL